MFKKVLFYIDSLQYGGAERVMANLCNSFCKLGKDIVLVNDIMPDANKPEYSLDINVRRYFLHGNNKKAKIRRIFALRRIVKKERPDIVISFLGSPNLRAILATFGLKTPLLVSVRNDPWIEYGRGLKRLLSRFLFSFAKGYVFQTEEASQYFSKKVRKKSIIIGNPIASVFFDKKWTGTKKEIAVVGRLQRQKNPLLALKAFKIVHEDCPDYKIVFYGDDELKTDVVETARELNLQDSVIIYGKTNRIADKLADSSLYLLSSDYEGMPNALLEAMAVGVPIVSTDCPCGGPRTIIINEDQGLLVRCNNPFEMAEAIKQILFDKEKQLKMSRYERERAKDFREEVIIDQWLQYIDGIVK